MQGRSVGQVSSSPSWSHIVVTSYGVDPDHGAGAVEGVGGVGVGVNLPGVQLNHLRVVEVDLGILEPVEDEAGELVDVPMSG